MAENNFGKGIKITSGFDLSAKLPLDNRYIVKTLEERDAHVTNNRAYEGMKVYVLDEKKEYTYDGTEWTEQGGISDEQLEQLIIAYEHSQSKHVTIEDIHTHDNKSVLDNITQEKVDSWDNKSEFDGNYDNLTNKPIIPTKTSELTNDSSLATETYVINKIAEAELNDKEIDLSGYATKDELHNHTNKTILDGITSDKITSWDNKSTFDGDYNSLTNKPSIPSIDGLATEDYVNQEINKIDVTDQLTDYAKKSELPTKTSELTNDSNFLTSIPSEYITETELNNKGYLTEHQSLEGYAKTSDLHTHDNKSVLDGITSDKVTEWNNKSTFDGNYNSLTNKPTIPSIDGLASETYVDTKISDVVNSAPETLDTLNELAKALGNDENFSTTITTQIGTKVDKVNGKSLIDDTEIERLKNVDNYDDTEILNSLSSITDGINDLEKIESSEIEPTNEMVSLWINTSEETPTNVIARINDDTVASNTTWSSEKINAYIISGSGNSGGSGNVDLSAYALKTDIPTATSQLTNDSNFITSIPSEYVTETELTAKGYLTEHQDISEKADKTELHNHSNKTILDGITSEKITSWDNKSTFSGSYNDLTDKPTIPTKTSELTNDSDYTTKLYVDTKFNSINNGNSNSDETSMTTINVIEHGCVANGTTDNLTALKSIFASVTNDTIIYFPTGTYLIGNGDSTKTLLTLTGLDNVIIKGDGKDATKLILHQNTPVGIDYGILELKQCTNSIIKDLELDGNVQLRHKNHGSLWDDLSTNYDNMSNIEISSGENILIENVYTHHPAMDCIFVGRHAGGTTPNGNGIIIRNCTLEYGYRQGISIVGWDNGLIQDCIIGETALAENLLDSSVKLGTSPMAGLDSETWSTNYDWIIERTTFNNNYVDINDGSVRFIIRDCILNNSDFYSSTPSAGARTYDILCKNNMMIDSIIDIYNKGFIFEENTIKITSGLKKSNADAQLKFVHDPTNIWYKDGATNVIFRNNVVMVVADASGTLTPSTKICYPYLMGDMVMENNIFLDCFFNTFSNDDGSFGVFANNIFRMTDTTVAYNLNNAKHLVENNHFIGNFYLGATTRTISSDPSVGTMAFDSSTNKPIWWNGSTWVDAINNTSTSGGYTHPETHPATMITGLSTVATSGSYNDLSNKPTIPTKTSELINDSDFATKTYVDTIINDIDYDSLLAFDTNEIITNPNYVDSNYNIILDDDLPAGTYTLKYEFKDGTYTDIKNFIISNESVNLMKESEIYLNQRYSQTNGGFITQPGVFSLIAPFTNINNDTMVLSFSNLKYTLLATNSTLYILDNNKSNPLTVNGDCDFRDMSSGVEVSNNGLSGTVTFVPPINEGYLAISVRIKDDGTEIATTDFENYVITLTIV